MGVSAIPIMVEVNVDNGIGFHLVGLPDSAVVILYQLTIQKVLEPSLLATQQCIT